MSHRSILLIHDSSTLRNIVRRYLMSEANDIDLREIVNGEEGLDLLRREKFDFVLCGNEIGETDGLGIHEEMVEQTVNSETPFLLLTSSPDEAHFRKFRAHGVENILTIPFSAVDLMRKINEVCNPRLWRRHERVGMHGTRVRICVDDFCTEGSVVNLSESGMLCDIAYSPAVPLWTCRAEVTVLFPPEFAAQDFKAKARMLRASVLYWKREDIPEALRTAWHFRDLADEQQDHLNAILRRVQEA